MATITIGNAATDRSSAAGSWPECTTIASNSPAGATGYLTKFEIWVWIVTYNWMKIGTFSGSGGTWTNRDHEDFGTVNSGSKQTFTGLDCTVYEGDCIGFFGYCGNPSMIEADTGGSTAARTGDFFEAGENAGYSTWSNTISLYGEGSSYDAPTVTTQDATDIDKTACTGNGNVTHDGGTAVTERGVCYCVRSHGDPDINDYKQAAVVGGEGAFTADVMGLEPATYYNMRAYATNAVGITYGETVEFQTLIAGSYIEVLTADRALALDNTTAFTPAADYEPATKKYVDDAVGGLGILESIDEDNMASNSDTKVPTQQSVKKYVDDNTGSGGGFALDGGVITNDNDAAIIFDLGMVAGNGLVLDGGSITDKNNSTIIFDLGTVNTILDLGGA